MIPLTKCVSGLWSRPQAVRGLYRNLSTTRKDFKPCGCKDTREECPPKKCDTKVHKAKGKCKPMAPPHKGLEKAPEFCTKTALAELSWKIQDLQKSWDMISNQVEKDCEARGYTKEKKAEKPKPECKPTPPKKEEEPSGSGIYVIAAALAFAALIGYYLYLQGQEKEKDGDKDAEKEEEKSE